MAVGLVITLVMSLSVSMYGRTDGHNITAILEPFPEYRLYNSYLSQTKLADEINSRQTLTCLALNNGAMSALAAKHPLSVIKNALALLTLLDYYDPQKLHDISKGTTLSTTLYQTTGKADGNLGFVNITDLKGGKVAFGSAAPGSNLSSTFTKSVKQLPYNISVLEVDSPIVAPGLLSAPAPTASNLNITALLDKAGCKTFSSLLVSSGVLKMLLPDVDAGLTLFAPSDEAFKAKSAPDLSKLSSAELVSLLQYHALSAYNPIGTLKTSRGPIPTLASNGPGKYSLKATSAGDSVSLETGVDSSRIASTVVDETPVCIFTVDSILLPSELFGASPSPAPAPAPAASPSPSPTPAPASDAPPPELASPPAPPMNSPAGSPALSPDSSENSSASAAVGLRAPAAIQTLALISLVFVSRAVSSSMW